MEKGKARAGQTERKRLRGSRKTDGRKAANKAKHDSAGPRKR